MTRQRGHIRNVCNISMDEKKSDQIRKQKKYIQLEIRTGRGGFPSK